MKIYKNKIDAIKFVQQSNLEGWEKVNKTIQLKSQGIAKMHDTIIIVDEYGLLD